MMNTIASLAHQSIINCLNDNYGITVTTLTPLLLGADIHAATYKALAADKQTYFIKIKRGHQHDISVVILELLQAAGIQALIPPLKSTQGHSIERIDDFSLIVYPFIEGQDGFYQDLTNEQWVTLGKALKQVHSLSIPLTIQQQIRQETFSPKWRSIVRSLYAQLSTASLTATHDIALQLSNVMMDKMSLIMQLVNRAEQLSQSLQHRKLEFVLCHSDIHGGNVLIAKDGVIYIVDWDEPMMAPKERDLMFIGGGVANVWNKPHEEALFYQGYATTDVNREILSYYRHERIVEDIAIYGQELLLTTTPPENASIMLKHFMDMFHPQGVVDIALKTDSLFDL